MIHRLPAALIPLALIPLALLAGCGEEPVVEPTDNDGRAAEGEVIGGTISDAMLPLDTVRSQAPRAVAESAAGSGEPTDAAAAPSADDDGAEPAAATAEPEVEADEDDA